MLKDLFKKLCCCHQWQQYTRVNGFKKDSDKMPVQIKEILICTKCGKIKQITL